MSRPHQSAGCTLIVISNGSSCMSQHCTGGNHNPIRTPIQHLQKRGLSRTNNNLGADKHEAPGRSIRWGPVLSSNSSLHQLCATRLHQNGGLQPRLNSAVQDGGVLPRGLRSVRNGGQLSHTRNGGCRLRRGTPRGSIPKFCLSPLGNPSCGHPVTIDDATSDTSWRSTVRNESSCFSTRFQPSFVRRDKNDAAWRSISGLRQLMPQDKLTRPPPESEPGDLSSLKEHVHRDGPATGTRSWRVMFNQKVTLSYVPT
ncbi:unnamed protein product [Lampetra fluviatilis]